MQRFRRRSERLEGAGCECSWISYLARPQGGSRGATPRLVLDTFKTFDGILHALSRRGRLGHLPNELADQETGAVLRLPRRRKRVLASSTRSPASRIELYGNSPEGCRSPLAIL